MKAAAERASEAAQVSRDVDLIKVTRWRLIKLPRDDGRPHAHSFLQTNLHSSAGSGPPKCTPDRPQKLRLWPSGPVSPGDTLLVNGILGGLSAQ